MSGGPTALLKVLAGILEDAVQSLQRIEVKIEEHTKIFNQISKRVSDLEAKMATGFDVIRDQGFQTLEDNINTQFESLGLQDFDKMEFKLDTLINKLQKGIHILSVQGIIGRIEKLVTVPTGGMPRKSKSQAQAQEPQEKQQKAQKQPGKKGKKPAASQAPPPDEEEADDGQPHLLKPSSFFGS